MKKLLSILLSVCMFVSLSLTINAEETEEVPQEPEETQEIEETTKEDEETIPETFEEDGEEVEETTEDVEETPETEKEELEEQTTSPDYTDEEKEAVADKYDEEAEDVEKYPNGLDDDYFNDIMPTDLGDPNDAAQGDTLTVGTSGATYTTITSALAAITDGAKKTIQLITDITENVTISVKEVILDLFGHTLKNSSDSSSNTYEDTIYVNNGSTLTIKDSSNDKTGKVTITTTNYSSALFNNGTTIIEGGTFTTEQKAKGYTIINHGDMTINGGTVTRDSSNATLDVIQNGYNTSDTYQSTDNSHVREAHTDGYNSASPKLTINDGTFNASESTGDSNGRAVVVANADYGVLEINGGTFSYDGTGSNSLVISNYNLATINGGTFTSKGAAVIANNKTSDKIAGLAGELNITDGTFKTTGENTVLITNDAKSSTKGNGTTTINGGTYETSNTVSTTDSLTNVVINEATFTNKLDTTGLEKISVAGATATINTDSKTYVGSKTITELINNASKGAVITIESGSINITTTNPNVTIKNSPTNTKGLIIVNGKVLYGTVDSGDSSDNSSSSSSTRSEANTTCEEWNNSKDWTWSEKLGKCVYIVSNSKAD